MRRDRTTRVVRNGRRRNWRIALVAAGLAAAAGILVLGTQDSPPASRPIGAGLPPSEVPRLQASLAPAPADAGGQLTQRRAEIAAEETRLAALREARAALERDIAALRQEAEQRLRDMPGRKTIPDGLATGASPPPQAAGSSGAGIGGAGGQASTQNLAAAAVPPNPAVPPPTTTTEPPARGLRVFVHHRANSPPGANAAAEVAEQLRGAGFEVAPPRAVPFVPSTPVVRYFHEEDQQAAARLAGRLGRGWAIQDFRAFLPQPAPQTLEVWLPAN
jgi:hypothetical protein